MDAIKELALINSVIQTLIEINEETLEKVANTSGEIMLNEQNNAFATVQRIINNRIRKLNDEETIGKLHPSLKGLKND